MTANHLRTEDGIQLEIDEWLDEELHPAQQPCIAYYGPNRIYISGDLTYKQLRTLASIVNTDAPDDTPTW